MLPTRQYFITPFQQTAARQHAQQIDHDENAVGIDDQRIQIDIKRRYTAC
jgi:flagellar basal body rod protein FlgB